MARDLATPSAIPPTRASAAARTGRARGRFLVGRRVASWIVRDVWGEEEGTRWGLMVEGVLGTG
jgi:hypothetical protein